MNKAPTRSDFNRFQQKARGAKSVDGDERSNVEEEEAQADRFADELLIPLKFSLRSKSVRSKQDAVSLSKEIGVHVGILVGRLQNEKIIQFSWFNALKQRVAWKDVDDAKNDALLTPF